MQYWISGGSRIFPGGAPTPKIAIIFHIFAKNCMKMKEFGPPGGGTRPWCPPLDPPMRIQNLSNMKSVWAPGEGGILWEEDEGDMATLVSVM